MAKRRTTKRRPANRRKSGNGAPGWVWMLFGLAIGLTVAYAVYSRGPLASAPKPAPQAASVVEDEQEQPSAKKEDPPKRESEYDFYTELPRYELVLPDEVDKTDNSPAAEAVKKPGVYEIQAGSFGRFADADRRRAELAFMGIESRVQRVSVDDKTYHRVRIGPLSDLSKVNALRGKLGEARIDYRVFRVSG